MIQTKDEKDFFFKWFEKARKLETLEWEYECDDGEKWSFFKRQVGKGCIIYKREEDTYNASRDLSDINGFKPFVLVSDLDHVYCYDDSLCEKGTRGFISFHECYNKTNRFLWEYEVPEIYKNLNIELDKSEKKLCKIEAREIVRGIQLGCKEDYDIIIDRELFSSGDYEAFLLGIADAKSIIREKLENNRNRDFKIGISKEVKRLLDGPELITDYEKELAKIFRSHELVKVYLTLDNGKEELVQPDISSFFLNELVTEEPLLWTLDRTKEYGFESISRIVDSITGETIYNKEQEKEQDNETEREEL